jgi:hypothetical protein
MKIWSFKWLYVVNLISGAITSINVRTIPSRLEHWVFSKYLRRRGLNIQCQYPEMQCSGDINNSTGNIIQVLLAGFCDLFTYCEVGLI